jgi:hypothetical protein
LTPARPAGGKGWRAGGRGLPTRSPVGRSSPNLRKLHVALFQVADGSAPGPRCVYEYDLSQDHQQHTVALRCSPIMIRKKNVLRLKTVQVAAGSAPGPGVGSRHGDRAAGSSRRRRPPVENAAIQGKLRLYCRKLRLYCRKMRLDCRKLRLDCRKMRSRRSLLSRSRQPPAENAAIQALPGGAGWREGRGGGRGGVAALYRRCITGWAAARPRTGLSPAERASG